MDKGTGKEMWLQVGGLELQEGQDSYGQTVCKVAEGLQNGEVV